GFLRLGIQHDRGLVAPYEKDLAMPPAGYKGRIVEDDQSVTACYLCIDRFLGVIAIVTEFLQALTVQCIQPTVVAFQSVYVWIGPRDGGVIPFGRHAVDDACP